MVAVVSAQTPFFWVPDLDGAGLDRGTVYFGVANLDPITNPVAIFFDPALSVSAENPATVSGGFVIDGTGTPQNVYVDGDFSIAVLDGNGRTLYSLASYAQRFLSSTITFGAVIVSTSIDPASAGGATNGAALTPWASTTTRDLQAKTGTVYNQAQPAVAADLAAFNQRKQLVMSGRMIAAVPTASNIYNVSSIIRTAAVPTGSFDIIPIVALPANFSVSLTNTLDVPACDLVVSARSTTLVRVKTYTGGVLADVTFDFLVFGNPAVADPIS